jgi:hypothetical protein
MSDNLIPQSERTKEEQRVVAKKGGIASGKVRRERKAMKDTLASLLSMPLQDGKVADVDDIKNLAAVNGKNITVQEAIMLKQIQKAMKGDTRAAEYIRDTSGNKLKDYVELSGGVNNPFSELTTEELKKLIENG